VSAIPTLVELEKSQYDEFLLLISQIAIDIDSENITLNADFHTLSRLQNETIHTIEQFEALFANADYFRTVQLTHAFDWLGEGLKNINNSNIDGFLLINKTLGDIYELEREEVQAISSEFFKKIDKINSVLGTINAFVDTIETVIGVIQTFISTTQNQNLITQITEQQRTNTLLQQFIDIFPTKVLETIDSTGFVINAEAASVQDTAYTWCEISDPTIGEGPINCQTNAMVEFNAPVASITSIPVSDREDTSN